MCTRCGTRAASNMAAGRSIRRDADFCARGALCLSTSADARARRRRDTRLVRPTAMIVDDHPSFRRLAGRMLVAAGYTVIGEAVDTEQALVAARRLRPDFVLLDVMLPDGSGIDVADELASDGGIVLLTSSKTAEDLGESLEHRTFVTKSELSVERLAGLIPRH